jgi:acetate kinase
MVSALGGIDGLVFTGGAGEASSRLRADVCGPLGFLGLSLDPVANDGRGDRLISRGSVAAAVVESREDLQIARQVRSVLGR